jgi:fructosamine-3-kinase
MSALSTADEFDHLGPGSHHVRRADGMRVFVKQRRDVPADFFQAEARGLAALAASPLRVPRLIAVWEHGVALEDLGHGNANPEAWTRAGAGLAQQHRIFGEYFGSAAPGWCGDSMQDNTPETDGFRFFAERRLLPQAQRAFDSAHLEDADLRRLESICARLPELLPTSPAVLVHGDLWLGNLHVCADGAIALIDCGAAHYGWAEGDLAMLTLFGAPPDPFFHAYECAAAIDSRWRERAALLNLYHLLNHLNLFGAGYLAAVRGVLARYT